MELTNDRLLKIALITSLIGILGLIIFSPYIEVKEISIKDINRGMVDEEISIVGIVDNIKKSASGTNYFLSINDGTGTISLVIFNSTLSELKDSAPDIEMFKGKKIKAIGKITEFNSELEMILSNGNSLTLK